MGKKNNIIGKTDIFVEITNKDYEFLLNYANDETARIIKRIVQEQRKQEKERVRELKTIVKNFFRDEWHADWFCKKIDKVFGVK